jgi:hypothetical protein
LDPHKRPKTLKKRPKTPKNAPKRPKTPPKRPKTPHKRPFFGPENARFFQFSSGQFFQVRSVQVISGQFRTLKSCLAMYSKRDFKED